MGILYDHGQGTAQVILFNVPDVNAVIGDAAAVYFIKTVDQIDDGGLACPGGTHKSDFLSWFGIEADAVQDGLFRRIAEHHLVETHIALKGNQAECLAAVVRVRKDRYPGRDFPGKILGESGALLHFPVPIHSHVAERHAAFIRFLAFIHHIENTFRAGKGCQQEINLLFELVQGHGALAHIDKIGSKDGYKRQTEAGVARAQGNYAPIQAISEDVRAKLGGGTIGVIFPILSRNRFSICLKGIAGGAKKVVLMLSYPTDEVGNSLVSLDQVDEAGINPYSDVLTLERYRELFGAVSYTHLDVYKRQHFC